MNIYSPYRTITREQFLFHEMRIVAKLILQGLNDKEIIDRIVKENLFQYPTERSLRNIARVCLARFRETDSTALTNLVANGSSTAAKQACLFLMMNYYRIVWEFMIQVIGQKYILKDNTLTKMDLNSFFSSLQAQNETVASWSDETIRKCKQVLKSVLIENGYLDHSRSEVLNPVLLDLSVKEAIENLGMKEALCAFNWL